MAKNTYSNDGIKVSNRNFKTVEPILTVAQLKKRYLFGVTPIVDNEGNEMPDSTLQNYINVAVSMLEHYLDISITPRCDVEERDYYQNDYWDWGYIQLNNFPVINIEKVEQVYFRDEDGSVDEANVQEFPKSWYRVDKHSGIFRLIPNTRFPAKLQISKGGLYFPEVLQTNHVPHLWRITYNHGFKDGKVPMLINEAIGYLASLAALSIAGNLVLGAGIASQSISLDGLSQSITTTSSAENSAYSATRKEYYDRIFGTSKDDPSSILRILKDYYKGETINII